MIEDLLSIVVITYNRAKLLDRTLSTLFGSPFANVPITVLNNASADNTVEICQKYSDRPNFRLVTHKFNISGDGNILRAYEYAETEYIWVVSDDDFYDFSNIDDLLQMLEQRKYDLIQVGGINEYTHNRYGGMGAPIQELMQEGYNYFRLSSNITHSIIRVKALMDYIIPAYRNIVNHYPHMPFLLSVYEKNSPVYITKGWIQRIEVGSDNYSYYEFLEGWIATSRYLSKNKDRRRFIMSQFEEARSKVLAGCYLSYIKRRAPHFSTISTLWCAMPWKNKLGSIFIVPFRFFEVRRDIKKYKRPHQDL